MKHMEEVEKVNVLMVSVHPTINQIFSCEGCGISYPVNSNDLSFNEFYPLGLSACTATHFSPCQTTPPLASFS